MKESTKKINQYIKLIIKGLIMYIIVFALLVKMQIELVSHLKRQRCENCKENTECLTKNKQNCQNTGHVTQTKEGPVY